jgi:hypothetical protein
MPRITNECPHCSAQNVLFGLTCTRNSNDPKLWNCIGTCNGCGKAIVVVAQSSSIEVGGRNDDLRALSDKVQFEVFPTPGELIAPLSTEPTVAGYYVQGLASLRGKHWDAAGTMFRKSLEVALKKSHVMEGRPTIFERINGLPEATGVTPAMKTWAHRIRSLGADAAHEEDPFTESEARELHEFAEAFLTYFFTLPAKVAKHQTTGASPAPAS